jgi:tripartite-type tricarboxylate transporter receptor subunit TctC
MPPLLKYPCAPSITFVLACALAPVSASAESYPSKPARLIVPFGAGATTDIIARIFANKLSEIWGQQLVVENRPGAGGVIGTESAAKATPDGYTLALCGISVTIAPALYKAAL